jgi:hypothetical protein
MYIIQNAQLHWCQSIKYIENNYVNRKLQQRWVVIRATSACGRVRLD